MKDIYQEALELHEKTKGKLEVQLKVPLEESHDLSLAYTPGVAQPCREIAKNKDDVYKYTWKQNSVAVVSDGTAVLGLGDIGPEAAMPVMEGKAVLFKKFGNIDAVPICLDTKHGTAIVVTAGLLNALKVVHKKIEDITVVVSGTGAAGSSIIKMIHALGVKEIYGFNINGIVTREDYDQYDFLTQELTEITNSQAKRMTMAEAMKEADVFIGVSAPGVLTPEMVKSMKENPIVFAMANPEPEIPYQDAIDAGVAVMGTGRSDYPNQINNVLAFPGLFRGALDVRARKISEGMKLAAAHGLASLVSDEELSPTYVIPNALDPRVSQIVAQAVAKKAIEEGLAR